jgi:hypothetical protein
VAGTRIKTVPETAELFAVQSAGRTQYFATTSVGLNEDLIAEAPGFRLRRHVPESSGAHRPEIADLFRPDWLHRLSLHRSSLRDQPCGLVRNSLSAPSNACCEAVQEATPGALWGDPAAKY